MYCTITAGLLLSNVTVASLPCSDFDQTAVEEQDQISVVEEPKVQVTSIDHSYVPLPLSQPKTSEINRDYNYQSRAIKYKKYVPVSRSYSR
jgi:hypothetical protein